MKICKEDLVGKKFGDLQVISRTIKPGTKNTAWECICVCGNVKLVLNKDLVKGRVKSCGCLVGKSTAKRFAKIFEPGQVVGRLTILGQAGKDKWNNWLFRCLCSCGKEHITKGTDIRVGKAISCGCAQRESVTKHGLSRTIGYVRRVGIQSAANRRARKKKLNEFFSEQEVSSLLIKQKSLCYYCQRHLTEFHRDHKQPLCKGGRNNIGNIALTCPPCNVKKGRKTEKEFFYFLGTSVGKKWLINK